MGNKGTYKKIILVATLVISSLGLLTACGGGDTGRSRISRSDYDRSWYTSDNRGLRQNDCVNCSYNNVVADVIGQTNTYNMKMEMGLSLFSDSNYGQNDYYNGYNSYAGSFNSGRVSARGYLQVYETQSYSNCRIPSGDYEVDTVREGTLAGLTMSDNLSLEAYSHQTGAVLQIELSQVNMLNIGGYQGADGYSYNLGFWGYADVTLDDPYYGRCYVGYIMINTPSVANLY